MNRSDYILRRIRFNSYRCLALESAEIFFERFRALEEEHGFGKGLAIFGNDFPEVIFLNLNFLDCFEVWKFLEGEARLETWPIGRMIRLGRFSDWIEVLSFCETSRRLDFSRKKFLLEIAISQMRRIGTIWDWENIFDLSKKSGSFLADFALAEIASLIASGETEKGKARVIPVK